jgi:hypothetical protein
VAVAVAGLVAMGGTAMAKGGALDGKSFTVDSGEKGKPAGKEVEKLTFKDGKFRSAACDAYGFGDAAYTAHPAGAATAWEADTVSPKEGRIHWKGTAKGDTVEGTFVWSKPGQAPIEYWFKSK